MSATIFPLLLWGTLLLLVGFGALAASYILPRFLGVQRRNPTKGLPYECGVPSPGGEGARGRISIRFYLVAILFILFDVETVFLIPWAAQYKVLGPAAFLEVLVFMTILIVAYVYVWKRGVLDWE